MPLSGLSQPLVLNGGRLQGAGKIEYQQAVRYGDTGKKSLLLTLSSVLHLCQNYYHVRDDSNGTKR